MTTSSDTQPQQQEGRSGTITRSPTRLLSKWAWVSRSVIVRVVNYHAPDYDPSLTRWRSVKRKPEPIFPALQQK